MTSDSAKDTVTSVLYPTNIHCADCVRDMINGVLRDQNGVVDASYDPGSGALSVSYQPDSIGEEEIRKKISDLGYGFAEGQQQREARPNRLLNLLAIAIIVIFLAAGVIVLKTVLGS